MIQRLRIFYVLYLYSSLPYHFPPKIKGGRPRNIDLSMHWNLLRLFLLFFSWDLLQYICDQTNSYAYRNNEAGYPWQSISPIELLHFLGCLIIIGLFNQPPRKYLWNQRGGCLRGTPISKNRFEQIVKYIHFNDRGPNPVSNQPWWSKLDYILSGLRTRYQKYWIPGPYATVDEIMLAFEGRTS